MVGSGVSYFRYVNQAAFLPKSQRPQILMSGRRFPASSGRIVLLAGFIFILYAAGLGFGGWAATVSLAAVRSGREVPWAPWLLAFLFMVSGMLFVVYGFFFRPRAVEIDNEEVSLVKWDGKGNFMRREELQSVKGGSSRILLRSHDTELSIPRIFTDWNTLCGQLESWRLPQ
jgi:hypothetical protein